MTTVGGSNGHLGPGSPTDVLAIFKNNDVDRLYDVGAKLWSRRVFEYYLTTQQLLILQSIFEGPGGTERAKENFVKLLKGEVFLRFVQNEPAKDTEGEREGEAETTKTNEEPQPEAKDAQKEERQMLEVTVQNGVEPARVLALKVRYILWDKAIDYLYDDDKTEEYELFDAADEDKSVEKPTDAPVVNSAIRQVDEDDDYDDDDDDEEDEKEKTAEKTTAEDSVTAPEFDADGNVVLEVPIATSETAQVDNKVLIENFNKIYHNFENDKETLIKRRKLEENDKLLENDNSSNTKDLISMNLGAANLSLKHLLRSIDDNKDKLQFQDNELRQLIMDVRKNRSKWASDDKIGQEELYEACEKVVMELRGYTEHSTAFLNRVSKRDAPNYYQIIKTPMDLNTILKKLKSFQYKSKTEFVDDVMLIWKNCFTYNTDPRHFLRAHAIAMQKKTLQLIPLIPDITVRDRAEVEAEAAVEESSTPAPHGKTTSKKGKKRTRNGEVKEENGNETPVPGSANKTQPPSSETPAPPNGVTAQQSELSTPAPGNISTAGVGENTELLEDEDNGESNEYLNTEDNDKDDMETQMWKSLTSKTRAEFCIKRSDLFKEDNQLNSESEAILRAPKKMKEFVSYLKHYTETKKHIFNVSQKHSEEDPYLIEYDITGGLPSIGYSGVSEEEIEKLESKLVEQVMKEGLKPSKFVPQDGGLNKVMNENIEEMQEIRRICFKISLIRRMQQQEFLHQNQLKAPEVEKIDDSVDIDPVSRLENRDQMNKELMYFVLRKRVSKVAMLSGFETTELAAVDTLTQVAGDYMDNLVRTIKTHLETPSANKKQKEKHALTMALLQNGITKPEELHSYVNENVLKQRVKLRELKQKLVNFLKQLLRPAVEMSEKNFDDNSEQFMSGDFSNEIGDDFFGFKELGLDKEFGSLGAVLPLHLLQSKFAEASTVDEAKKVHREEFEKAPFPKLKDTDIEAQVGLFQPFLRQCLEKTKMFHAKQYKTKREAQEYLETARDLVIMEDEDFPKKPNKPKLPPTGKIPSTKHKITPQTFFLPEVDPVPVTVTVEAETMDGTIDPSVIGGPVEDPLVKLENGVLSL